MSVRGVVMAYSKEKCESLSAAINRNLGELESAKGRKHRAQEEAETAQGKINSLTEDLERLKRQLQQRPKDGFLLEAVAETKINISNHVSERSRARAKYQEEEAHVSGLNEKINEQRIERGTHCPNS
jgi:chromosome segregation ATPase